jgi:hypothetical protein
MLTWRGNSHFASIDDIHGFIRKATGRQPSPVTVPISASLKMLDVIAVLIDVPEHGLVRGQVGTVVEKLDGDVFEIEFSDDEGRTYAELALAVDVLLVLHHRRVAAA